MINKNYDAFDYLNDIIIQFLNGQINIQEINLCGGRNGRKTYSIAHFCIRLIIAAASIGKKIAIYGFRLYAGKNIDNLMKEFQQAIDDYNLYGSDNKIIIINGDYIFKSKNANPRWTFSNGSFISLQGVRQSSTAIIALKGLASATNFDLSISICEEANEFDIDEFQAIKFAIRGAKNHLDIKMSNPDIETQEFIRYCIENAPFQEWEMEQKGEQFKLVNENGKNKIFHYTNYLINPYLSQDQINDFEELKKIDPIQYKIWGLGLPGRLQESVFSRYIDNASNDPNFIPRYFSIGVDIGQADSPEGHPTVGLFVGIDAYNRIKPLNEYFQWNAQMPYKSPNEIAKDIVEFCIKQAKKYPEIMVNGLDVYIDYGAGGLAYIDMMKQFQAQLFPYSMKWLNITSVKKEIFYIKDRIDIIIALLIAKKLLIDRNLTPNFVKQMAQVRYRRTLSDREKHKIEIIDIDDDFFDALCYSIMIKMRDLMNSINYQNQFLLNKKFK